MSIKKISAPNVRYINGNKWSGIVNSTAGFVFYLFNPGDFLFEFEKLSGIKSTFICDLFQQCVSTNSTSIRSYPARYEQSAFFTGTLFDRMLSYFIYEKWKKLTIFPLY